MSYISLLFFFKHSVGSIARNGTCYSSEECRSKGGTAAGTCAAGYDLHICVSIWKYIIYLCVYFATTYLLKCFSFGTCCVFVYEASGGIISQNCSYIRNPNYPSAYEDSSSLSFTIQKCDPSKYFVDYVSLHFRDYINHVYQLRRYNIDIVWT